RHPRVPAGLARDVDPGDYGAGHHHRRLRRDGGARLHDQLLDPVRDRAGDRYRGERAIVVVEGAVHNIEKGMSGREAASTAMRQLFGPIVGITLVLMSVFLPAAFLPGLTGRMYAQFALVIAATALLSGINAVTLKPTQSAMWLRPAVPPERRNIFYRAFNRGYAALERGYTQLIARMVERSTLMALLAVVLLAGAGFGFSRLPTGFLPIEDQGYLIALVQLPQGASLERT